MHDVVTLRVYRPADEAAVLAIFDSNTPEYFAPSERVDFGAFLRAPASDALVAVSADGAPVAFGAVYLRSADVGGLAWGMVHRAWHRRGVGRALMQARLARLWSLGVAAIRVQTSQHSAGFFARVGFVETDLQPNGFAPGIDQVTMYLFPAPTTARSNGAAGSGG